MERKCNHPDCWAPATSCVMGSQPSSACEFWANAITTKVDGSPETDSDPVVVPWSGRTLGLSDVGFVGARGKPLLVGIVGPHDAGKTTFLAAVFLLLLRAGKAGPQLFAGSYSLRGWDHVATHLRWAGEQPPRFPPHTTTFENRAPGLLHLAFRSGTGELRDLLFTDGPGEWFRAWAFNRNAVGAEGARWVSRHADVFVVFADCSALAGEEKGTARVVLKQIIDRLASERGDRPVFLVWSKCDVAVSPEVRSAVRQSLALLGGAQEFELSVRPIPPEGEVPEERFLKVVESLLSVPLTRALMVPAGEATVSDQMLRFRGRTK